MRLKYKNKIIETTEHDFFNDVGDVLDIHLYELILVFKQFCFLPFEHINVIKEHLIKRTSVEQDANEYLRYDLLLLKLLNNTHKIKLSEIEDDRYCVVKQDNKISCGDTQHIAINTKELLKLLNIKIIKKETNKQP